MSLNRPLLSGSAEDDDDSHRLTELAAADVCGDTNADTGGAAPRRRPMARFSSFMRMSAPDGAGEGASEPTDSGALHKLNQASNAVRQRVNLRSSAVGRFLKTVKRGEATAAEKAEMLFSALKGLSTHQRMEASGKLRMGALLQAFRLLNFELTTSRLALRQRVHEEERRTRMFQFHLGRVIDFLEQRPREFDVEWDDGRDAYSLDRDRLYELYTAIHDVPDRGEWNVEPWLEDVARHGRENCRYLRDTFFGKTVQSLCAGLSERSKMFHTLFLHFEANTESGEQDALLSLEEVTEMLQVLGHTPRELGVPGEDDSSTSRSKGGAGVLHERALELTPLHVMSDLGLEQALAVGDEDEAAEATGADASGGLRPIPDLRAAAGRGETVQQEPHVGVGDSITEDVEPGQQGRQPHSATPYYKLLAFYQQRDMADLDRTAFTSLCLFLMTPSLASRDSTRITRRDRLDVNADQSRFAMQFRYRMSLLYQSAEGAESSIDTKTVVYMIAVYLFFPFASLIATARVIRERTALGFDRDAAIRMFRRFFSLQFLVYLLGCLVWVSAVVNPILYVSTHAGCATLFEALYPGTMVGFGVLAGSIFRGYTARDIRPGKFKLHRMQVLLRKWPVVMRDFDSGEDQRMSAMDFLCEANQIVPSVSRRTGAKGLWGAFEAAYLHQLTKQGLVIWGTSTVLLSLVLALLPSILRSLPNSQFSTGSCGSFVSSGVEGLITSLYFAVGFSCTIGLSMVLVRMFVQFVHINRSWRMFGAIHHPVRARQRKERPVLISAITDDAGKLTGYLDMRRPENVQAWSKLRLYMQLFYEDEVRGVEIFLAHTVVLLVLIVISGGIFVYIPGLIGLEKWHTRIMVALLGLLGSMFAVPVLTILINGVSINEQLIRHKRIITRLRVRITEEHAQACASHGAHSSYALMLASARALTVDVCDVITERDRPLKILGVVLSMALVQTIVVALGTTVSGSVVKAVKRALAQQGGGASLGPSS